MDNHDVDKSYISPYDQFLYKFDTEHPKTLSQLEEQQTYKRIAQLRDNANVEESNNKIWQDF